MKTKKRLIQFNRSSVLIICISLLFVLSSCDQINIFEHNVTIPKHQWFASKEIQGSFQIDDTIKQHQLFLVLRHTDAYAYNNIWLEVSLQQPGDSFRSQRVNLPLGNDAQGWLGTGMDDIWEVRGLMTGQPKSFQRKGTYHFKIRQIMREDPLEHVMSVGLRVQ
jgi:gliding motility-associated lipoprotein GldH